MTDRKMLEWAAKAAGYTNYGYGELIGGCPALCLREADFTGMWAPLTDDGDALRLATKLRIEYIFVNDRQSIQCQFAQHTEMGDWETFLCDESIGEDVYASMRRAIVRAAAELGKIGGQG